MNPNEFSQKHLERDHLQVNIIYNSLFNVRKYQYLGPGKHLPAKPASDIHINLITTLIDVYLEMISLLETSIQT